MSKDRLILKNGTAIELEAGASLESMTVITADKMEMITIWGEMTEENLSEARVENSAGLIVGRYKDLLLASETSIIQSEGTIQTSFFLREKTDVEKRMDAIEQAQTVQDGAISDLGSAVSGLAEEGGLT